MTDIFNESPCPVCGMHFVPDLEEDVAVHRAEHKKLASGVLPHQVREFVKKAGWAVAHNNPRNGQYHEPAEGELAVAFMWWSRALNAGVPTKDFDAYMKAHLAFAHALATDTGVEQASAAVKRWERYAG